MKIMQYKDNFTLYTVRSTLTQTGFSQLILVALLALGIITGTYLIQNGTNFLPHAQEQEGLNPSAGRTRNCSDAEDKAACQSENDATCARDTVTYCDNRSGSPRAIRKSGGYYDPSHPHTDPASGCVFDYREVSGKNSECGKPQSQSGDVVYTTKDEAQRLDKERADTQSQRERESGTSRGTTDKACPNPEVTETAFKDEKVTGNLVRYYGIMAGIPNYCVPMDMGVGARLTAKAKDSEQRGRLMLCSGENSSADNLDLTWRILPDGGKQLFLADKKPLTKGSEESEINSDFGNYIKDATDRAQASTPQTPAQNPPPNPQPQADPARPPIIDP